MIAKQRYQTNGDKMEPVYEDQDRQFNREEYLQYLQDEELEQSMIKSPKEAMNILIEQMFKGTNQSYEVLSTATKFLADYFKIGQDIDFEESETKITFNHEVEKKVEKQTSVSKDDSKRMLKWVRDIEHEIYGEDTIDGFSIDSSISSLFWNLEFNRPSNRNINIRRK